VPPWSILEDRLEVPEAKSPFSSKMTVLPRRAASRAMAVPLMPPPMTARSKGPSKMGGRFLGVLFTWYVLYPGGLEFYHRSVKMGGMEWPFGPFQDGWRNVL